MITGLVEHITYYGIAFVLFCFVVFAGTVLLTCAAQLWKLLLRKDDTQLNLKEDNKNE